MYLLFLWRVRNGFEAGKIHYKGHWKGWALEIDTFFGPEMATKRVPFGALKSTSAFKLKKYE
jgi:hypothetical protein